MTLDLDSSVCTYVPVHSPEDAADEETPSRELDEGGYPGVGGPQVHGLHHLVDVWGGEAVEIGGGEHGDVSAAGGGGNAMLNTVLINFLKTFILFKIIIKNTLKGIKWKTAIIL